MIGRSLAHYSIVEKLGQGGMGVVYKARDMHLDRFVALKVLPPAALADPARKQRFVQEARAASALNHPNIVHIYDISSAEDIDFIAMEYVQGRTLDTIIGRKGLRLGEALGYACQIADALAKAHSAGIIHRDLKPSNVMVNEDGIAKILDFGLAKLTESPGSGSDVTETVIDAAPLTERGAIMGTLAYMSPEQAQGLPVDARSDIFSFGSVLYEMLTGAPPFSSPSKAITLASIIEQDPKPLRQLGAEVPDEVEKLLMRCLRKDPRRRWQTMSDLKVALQDLKEDSESGRLSFTSDPVLRPKGRGSRWLIAVGALLIASAGLAGVFRWYTSRKPAATAELEISRLTFDMGLTSRGTISPDGKLLAFASDRGGRGDLDIYIQQVGSSDAVRRTQNEAQDSYPTFSPDGTQIAFASTRDGGGIYTMGSFSGEERRIADGGVNPHFAPDGSAVLYTDPKTSKMYLVSPQGGTPRPLAHDFVANSNPMTDSSHAWSPDSKYVLFAGMPRSDLENWDWWVVPVNGGAPVQTGLARCNWQSGSSFIPYAWTGNRIIFSQGTSIEGINLFSVPIDPGTWRITCTSQRLTSGPGVQSMASVANDGRIVFTYLKGVTGIWSYPLDMRLGTQSGEPSRFPADETGKIAPALSADGSHLAYVSYTSRFEIRLRDIAAGRESVITAQGPGSPVRFALPRLSPDGTRLAYQQTSAAAKPAGMLVSKLGTAANQVCEGCTIRALTADPQRSIVQYGSELVYQNFLTGSRTPILKASGPIREANLSADGQWIALLTQTQKKVPVVFAVALRNLPVPESRWVAACEDPGMTSPAWSADGNIIYFFSDRDGNVCVYGQRVDDATKRPSGPVFAVRHEHRASYSTKGPAPWRILSVARNRLVYIVMETTGNIYMAKLPHE